MSPLKPWRVERSRRIVEDQWIRLRADDCVTAEGHLVAPFYVLEYPDWVHVVAVSPDQRVLLIEQYRHGVGELSLEIPAGGVDAEDNDPVAAARRELAEETGCEGAAARLLQASAVNPASHTNRAHTVLIRDVVKTREPQRDPSENIRACWVSPRTALDWAASGRIPGLQAASITAAFLALGWLGYSGPPD